MAASRLRSVVMTGSVPEYRRPPLTTTRTTVRFNIAIRPIHDGRLAPTAAASTGGRIEEQMRDFRFGFTLATHGSRQELVRTCSTAEAYGYDIAVGVDHLG